MISLPLTQDIEHLIEKLPESEKKSLSLLIRAFVLAPQRNIGQVMDDMATYARSKGLTQDELDDLLKHDE